jgi:hypothetical protein
MAAMDDDASITSYSESLANFGAAYAATQESMKTQATTMGILAQYKHIILENVYWLYLFMRSLDKDKDNDDEDINNNSELMLVFDLGGGTFGLSYSRLAGVGVTEVPATIGKNRLDGDGL